jgi:L-asparagine transporter-like permease
MKSAAPRPSGSFARIIERERGLDRALGARQLSMIALGGAIGTGLFLGSGFAMHTAGPAVIVSYAAGALIALALMACLAEMTIAHPTTGSFGAYAEHYLGPLAGFVVRYAYWSSLVLGVGTEITAVAVYMHYWFAEVPDAVFIAGFSALLIAINAWHVRLFGRVEYGLALVKVCAIVAFIALASLVLLKSARHPVDAGAAAALPGFHHYLAHGGFMPQGPWGVWVAVIIAVFSYLSIEMIAVAAGEAVEPERAVVRAFRSTVLRLVLFYLITLALMLAILPWTEAGVGASPFVIVMRTLGIPGAASIMNGVVVLAALSAMNSQLYTATRMMFSLARAGDAPQSLGRLSAQGTPRRALLVSSAGIVFAWALSLTAPQSAFLSMLAISSFGAMFTWLMIFVTHHAFRRRRLREGAAPVAFAAWGFPFTPLAGAAAMLALLATTPFTAAFRPTLLFGMPLLLALILIQRGRARRPPRSAARTTA